jgi:hypothetical protein
MDVDAFLKKVANLFGPVAEAFTVSPGEMVFGGLGGSGRALLGKLGS